MLIILTCLDGVRYDDKKRLAEMFNRYQDAELNQVAWWGYRGVQIEVKNQYGFSIQTSPPPDEMGLKSDWESLNLMRSCVTNLSLYWTQ